jgi:hypothetical protein
LLCDDACERIREAIHGGTCYVRFVFDSEGSTCAERGSKSTSSDGTACPLTVADNTGKVAVHLTHSDPRDCPDHSFSSS